MPPSRTHQPEMKQPMPLSDTDWRFHALAILVAIMLSGGFQDLFPASKALRWTSLTLMGLLLASLASRLPIARQLRPLTPFAVWLTCYFIWGTVVSPIPALSLCFKTAFYVCLIATTMAVLTHSPAGFRALANYLQLGLAMNLATALLLIAHPEYQHIIDPQISVASQKLLTSQRFAGLWGNPNQAGFAVVFIMLLSKWAAPAFKWGGRLCGLGLLYFTASRQAVLLLLLITGLFIAMKAVRNRKLTATFVLALSILGITIFGLSGSNTPLKTDNPTINRLIDISESETKAKGEKSRGDYLMMWKPYLLNAPWYGYGLGAMCGSDTPFQVNRLRTDVPLTGIHNLYLGIWIDVGLLGLLTFLVIVGRQAFRAMKQSALAAPDRWALASLAIVVLVDSLVKHSLLFDMPGIASYALFFILPSSRALHQA